MSACTVADFKLGLMSGLTIIQRFYDDSTIGNQLKLYKMSLHC